MISVGHRACAAQYPENTTQAVEASAPHVDRVEIDARRCGSGELVAFCDDTLDRVTTDTGPLAGASWDALENLEVAGSGATVPLLDDLIAHTPAETGIHLHLKEPGLLPEIAASVKTARNPMYPCSESASALEALREAGVEAPVGVIVWEDLETGFAAALDLDASFLEVHYSLCFETDVVERAHDAGVSVIAGGEIRDASLVSEIAETGVDGTLVDRWDIL